jgi:hypothetical protein
MVRIPTGSFASRFIYIFSPVSFPSIFAFFDRDGCGALAFKDEGGLSLIRIAGAPAALFGAACVVFLAVFFLAVLFL